MSKILEKINKFIKWIIYSFDNSHPDSASGRKLTAFVIINCVVVGHGFYYHHCWAKQDFEIFSNILIIDYVATGFFLGLVTMQQIISFKNGNNNPQN